MHPSAPFYRARLLSVCCFSSQYRHRVLRVFSDDISIVEDGKKPPLFFLFSLQDAHPLKVSCGPGKGPAPSGLPSETAIGLPKARGEQTRAVLTGGSSAVWKQGRNRPCPLLLVARLECLECELASLDDLG